MLIVLTVLVMLGGAVLLILRLSAPQRIEIKVGDPFGEEVLYDVVVDGVASSGVAPAPTTLTFMARRLSFAIIPADSTADGVAVSLRAPHETRNMMGDGVKGSYDHGPWESHQTLEAMSPVHVANMRRAREAAERSVE